jgi:hypothetical protein
VSLSALAPSEREAIRREVFAKVERVSATLPPGAAEELRQAALAEFAAAEQGANGVASTGDGGGTDVAEPEHAAAPGGR